jgi:hypothetical protein
MSWSMEAAGVTAAARLRCPNGSESFYSLQQVRGTREYDYAAPTSRGGRKLVYAPGNGRWFVRDQGFRKRRLAMGQEPEGRLDDDLEIDSETAENVTGGFSHLDSFNKPEAKSKLPEKHFQPEEIRY